MGKVLVVLVLMTSLLGAYDGPRVHPYEISNLLVQDALASKQSGAAWDPFGGAPDLYVEVRYQTQFTNFPAIRTRAIENSGTSAIWGESIEIEMCNPDFTIPEGYGTWDPVLTFKIWDSDTYQPDFVDSGEILVSDISLTETVSIECVHGTVISFDIRRLE
jgi:hypothetical protein